MIERTPLISVVIPVKNGAPWLRKTLDSVFRQTMISDTEVIILDSGSTDESGNITKAYPVQLIAIPAEDFNHGETRNLGVRSARGKFVVMTVQDAEPVDEHWLSNLLQGFDSDNVAGVCGQQIVPHDVDKNPIDWFRPVSEPRMRRYVLANGFGFSSLAPSDKMQMCAWDNVNAMYRRDVLLKLPFRRTSFAEDALWARDALESGYEIVYNPKAQVRHYHFETPDFIYRRTFTVHYHFFQIFGVRPEPKANGLKRLVSDLKILVFERRIPWRQKLKWLVFNFENRIAFNKATSLFIQTLLESPHAVDKKHSEICATAPQAPSPATDRKQAYAG